MKYKYKINNLDCANCANKIEKRLNECLEIDKAIVNFNKLTLTVYMNKKLDNLEYLNKVVSEIDSDVKISDDSKYIVNSNKKDIVILIVALLLSVLGMFIIPSFGYILIIISYILLLYKVFFKAIKLLRVKVIDENLLIFISCVGAYLTNNIHEGLMVIILYDIGKILESFAVNKSRKNISDLMDINVVYANRMNDGKIEKVLIDCVNVDDTVVVRKGEKIPTDGIVISGETKLDTSSITGESRLSYVSVNDRVLSGMINMDKVIYIRVTSLYKDSTVCKILNLIEDATDRKAKSETFVSKASRVYTPIVLILAIITILFNLLIIKLPINESIYRGLVFLVVSCPCAILISVPLSYFSAIGKASKEGILVKGSDYLEVLGNVEEIIFDKTGTITTGNFLDYKLEILDDSYNEDEIIKYYVSGEVLSNHPIAISICNLFSVDTFKVSNFKEISGNGIEYKIGNKRVLIGTGKFCSYEKSNTGIYLKIGSKVVANLILKDKIKDNVVSTIKELKELGINVEMYTGDKEEYAKYIAKEVGIDKYYSELLPQDKYNLLSKKLEKNKVVAFVGDGVNDTPSLKLSSVGISLGGIGSDYAKEVSDIVIMNDDIGKITKGIKLSKYTKRIVLENLIFALGTKIIILLLSFLGITSMFLAVFADTGVTLLTIINTMRILRVKV